MPSPWLRARSPVFHKINKYTCGTPVWDKYKHIDIWEGKRTEEVLMNYQIGTHFFQ